MSDRGFEEALRRQEALQHQQRSIYSKWTINSSSSGTEEIAHKKEQRILSDSKKKMSFLGGILVAFKEKILTDIQLRPGKDNGPCIPAHRVILASTSKIFKQMLECEPPPDQTITIPEMNSEELESLLELLYSGSLPQDKMGKHVRSLFHAAHKYEISFLQECCERHILDSLNVSNVLDALEISDVFSSQTIKEAAMKFIIDKMVEVTFSSEYEVFADKNPHLAVQITRAVVTHAKNHVPKKSSTSGYENQFRYENQSLLGYNLEGSWPAWPS